MRITLHEDGVSYPDAKVELLAQEAVRNNYDVDTSNILVIDCIRAELAKMPLEERPQVSWNFYGKEVFFNEYVASPDAYDDPRCLVGVKACGVILRNVRRRQQATQVR